MTKTARNLSLLIFAVALIGLLLILGPNLQRIELRPGEQDLSFLEQVDSGVPDLGTNPTGARVVRVLMQVATIAALACAAGILIGAIFNKRLRLYASAFLILCGLVFGLYYLMLHLMMSGARPITEEVMESSSMEVIEEQSPTTTEEETSPPAGWSFAVVAIGLSIGVVVLVAIAWTRFAPRWRRRAEDGDHSELEELLETVAAAADEIQLGGDPRSAVLRCYREMIRILCKRRRIDHVHMTARELAAALHRVGFTARHVDQLTEIFELVRYGNRTGRPRAERAIGCLAAIRRAYAS